MNAVLHMGQQGLESLGIEERERGVRTRLSRGLVIVNWVNNPNQTTAASTHDFHSVIHTN